MRGPELTSAVLEIQAEFDGVDQLRATEWRIFIFGYYICFVATVLNCTAAISSRGTVHYMNVAIRGKKTNIITKN